MEWRMAVLVERSGLVLGGTFGCPFCYSRAVMGSWAFDPQMSQLFPDDGQDYSYVRPRAGYDSPESSLQLQADISASAGWLGRLFKRKGRRTSPPGPAQSSAS